MTKREQSRNVEGHTAKGKRTALWLTGLLTAGLVLLAAFDVRLRVVTYQITSAKLTAPLCLVQISDLHSCVYGEEQETLLSAVGAQEPDAVLFTGDIVDERMPVAEAYRVFEELAKEYPCYYVTGNHEYWSGAVDDFCAEIEARGVTVLRGEREDVSWNGQALTLCGIDDPEDSASTAQLAALGAELDEERFSVLLAHRPERAEEYFQFPFDLALSGHAHGGQWRLPGLVNGLLAPNQGFFPPYAGGSYDLDGQTLVVSRGLARESTRIPRIFNRPELVVLRLLPAGQ